MIVTPHTAPSSAKFLMDDRLKSVSVLLPAEAWSDNLWVYSRDHGQAEYDSHAELWEAGGASTEERMLIDAALFPTLLARGEQGIWFGVVLPDANDHARVIVRGESGSPAEVAHATAGVLPGIYSIARADEAPEEMWAADPELYLPPGQTLDVADDDSRVLLLPAGEENPQRCVIVRLG